MRRDFSHLQPLHRENHTVTCFNFSETNSDSFSTSFSDNCALLIFWYSAAPAGQKSGLVPEGDVRLTANIRGDLHLKLKIRAAQERTTVGELIEQWIAGWKP